MEVNSLISEFKIQMDIIRRATAVVESIINKLDAVNSIPHSSASKRKTDEELISDTSKKIRIPISEMDIRSASTNPPISMDFSSIPVPSSQSGVASGTFAFSAASQKNSSRSDSLYTPENFEFAAVKPMKRVFVSRLPNDLSDEVLRRHILSRLPACEKSLEISVLPGRHKAAYKSVLISTGRDALRSINSKDFWPPETIVHQHRPRKPNNGFRPTQRRYERR